ncbi:MAG: MarR family transcriptional regulator [Verrucomicrobiales bacterium]|nr:MarR family transcriptional regulator [Verrucomicrobiales bacterium]
MSVRFNESPGFLIDRSAHMLRMRARAKLADLGIDLTTEEMIILVALNKNDGQRIGDLAALLQRDNTTLTRQIESLEKKGCVRRKSAPDDRRAVQVFLKKKGVRYFESFDPEMRAFRDQMLSGLSETEQKLLTACLRKIQANLSSL